MSVRAGIVVTGTEVLTGIISDRNGPWLSERLRGLGVEVAHIMVVGDRPGDVRAALEFLAGEGCELIVTSGGLGPTADDLTAEVVGQFAGAEMVLDEALEERIWAILTSLRRRFREWDPAALRLANRKQALVPRGATVLEPVGTAPGLVVEGPAVVVVLPGPPRELQPMWAVALETEAVRRVLADAPALEQRMMRLFGIPESEIALTLREIEDGGLSLEPLEITTCLRRGEIEIATVFEPSAEDVYSEFAARVQERHASSLFSADGATIDQQVADLLRGGFTIGVAESCTGGLMTARLTDVAGSSAYVRGGVSAYSDEAKVSLVGVDAEMISAHGAVSAEVAAALADGARAVFSASVGIGITGVAGPGGGTEAKPVGTVCFSVSHSSGERLDRTLQLPGDRETIRERSTTVAMHLLRRLLLSVS
jgi:nicotinamide-nucleotide amidase